MTASKAQLALALLLVAEGLRDELSHGHLEDFVPDTVADRVRRLNDIAWDALGNPTAADAHKIREAAKP